MRPVAFCAIAVIAAVALAEPAAARVTQTFGGTLRYPQSIALGRSGDVYVLDTSGRSLDEHVFVKAYSPSGVALRRWHVASRLSDVFDMATDAGDNVYVALRGERKVLKYSRTGQLLASIDMPHRSEAGMSMNVAVDPRGRLVVAEGDGRLFVFDAAGTLESTREVIRPEDRDENGVYGLAVTASGATWVSYLDGVALLDPAGGASRYIARRGSRPQDVGGGDAIAAGPADSVYVLASTPSTRIERFAADGAYLGSLGEPDTRWSDVAIAGDGSMFALTGGKAQHLTAITTVDIVAPRVTIGDVDTRPNGPSSRATVGVSYTLSERAAVRVAILRREDRGGYAGRYRHAETIRLAAVAAGRHTFEWLARSSRSARLRRGAYKLFIVASDDAGLESKPARARFSLRRL